MTRKEFEKEAEADLKKLTISDDQKTVIKELLWQYFTQGYSEGFNDASRNVRMSIPSNMGYL